MKLLSLIPALLSLTACSSAFTQATVDSSLNFKIMNVNSGLVLGINGGSQTAGTVALQWTDTGAADHLWHFVPAGNSQYWIVNYNSGQVLGISGASLSAGADALQYADNGTTDHLWTLVSAGNSQYKIKNANSGLVLGISGASKSSGAYALQWTDNGTRDHLWTLVSSGAAYVNPGPVSGNVVPVADPSMLKESSSLYYLYATGGGIQVRDSSDRSTFSPSNLVYAFSSLPPWATSYNSTDLWAPDASAHNGKYYMYYAASKFGTSTSAIGLATSTTGNVGQWTDSGGPVITSSTCSGINSIDPGLVVDSSSNWWLSFGSFFGGIEMVQLNSTTGQLLSSTPICYSLAKRLQGSAIEGTYIYPHGGYYYLFASLDACCQGVNSTYHIIVGRSTSPNGPYTDRGGVAMTQGGGTIILATHGNIIGPGGQSLFPDTDGDVLVYHYYDGNNNGYPTLGINLIGWTGDGWPYVH